MSAVVLTNKNKGVQDWVVDVPDHQLETLLAAWAGEGWSLKKNADPTAVVLEQAAANTEGA